MADSLVVGVCYVLPGFDADLVLRHVGDCDRRVEVVIAPYEESHALRAAKGQGRPAEELQPLAPPVPPAVVDLLGRAEAILTLDIPLDLRRLAPGLRWIQALGAGIAQFDPRRLRDDGIVLTTAAGVTATPIAEFVMGRILEVWKGTRHLEELQRTRTWQFATGRTLSGRTLGVVGLGAIGTAVATRAQAFGLRVLATRRRYSPGMTSPFADELYGPDGLGKVLEGSDIVVLALPETDQTQSLIGADELGLMKAGSVLCNVGRGSLVDEPALLAALTSGHLGAAILDVTREEPLPPDSPLWEAPNIYLSPHSAASVDHYAEDLAALLATNIRRYAAGEPLVNLVDPDAGY
jgi:phosphoglycerate dehydrogenase-like enzyme